MTGELNDVMVDLGTRLRKLSRLTGVKVKERVERRTPVRTGALRASYGITPRKTGFEFYSISEYAAYVELGTERMRPRAMVRTTLAEIDDILEEAAQELGL